MHKLHWSILVLGQHLALRLESWPGTEYELREDGIQSLWPSWLPASEGSRAQIPRSNVGQVAHVLLTPWVTSQKADITRRRYWGSLLALVRTLEQQQRRIATFALVHSTAEYWASVWCCSAHTHLIDPAINDVLRTVTGCLCPTPADNLPILTGIQPVELRRNGATLSLARSAMEPGHLLHSALTRPLSANARCLKSRHPFVPPHNISSVHLATTTYVRRSGQITNGMRSVDNPTRLRIFILDTGTHPPPRMPLPRRAWVWLTCLHTGDRRFRSCLYKWGVASSAACDCGAEEQTVNHVVLQCPIHWPPHGLHGLTVLDDETTEWLLNTCPEI